jgi:hypothetical protein
MGISIFFIRCALSKKDVLSLVKIELKDIQDKRPGTKYILYA